MRLYTLFLSYTILKTMQFINQRINENGYFCNLSEKGGYFCNYPIYLFWTLTPNDSNKRRRIDSHSDTTNDYAVPDFDSVSLSGIVFCEAFISSRIMLGQYFVCQTLSHVIGLVSRTEKSVHEHGHLIAWYFFFH